MPTYIPVYQRRLDPITGKPVLDSDGLEVMDLVKTIEVPDEPVYDSTPDGTDYTVEQPVTGPIEEIPIVETPIENP